MPIEWAAILASNSFLSNGTVCGSAFVGSLVTNVLSSLGYDVSRAGLGRLASRLGELFEGSGGINHDLLRAIRWSELAALALCCERCLEDDFNVETALFRTELAHLPRQLKPPARSLLALRRAALAEADRVQRQPPAELAAAFGLTLEQVPLLVQAGTETGRQLGVAGAKWQAEVADQYLAGLEQHAPRPRWWWLGRRPVAELPEEFRERLREHWVEYLALAFRERLKRDDLARRTYELDVLSRLDGFAPGDLAARLDQVRCDVASLNELVTELHGMVQAVGDAIEDLPEKVVQRFREELTAGAGQAGAPAALPPPPAILLERDAELGQVREALLAEPPRPVAVLGPGGIGKSTLTAAALHDGRVVARFGDRRYFVRCENEISADGLAARICGAIGLPPEVTELAAAVAALRQAPALLVLDNLETVWQADQANTEGAVAALTAVPGLAVMASLRGWQAPAPPTAVAWLEVTPSQLSETAALQLYRAIAGQTGEDGEVSALLVELEGLPLAVALLASAARLEADFEVVARRWERERTNLLSRGAGGRELSLAASLDVSLGSPWLTDEARQLLAALSRLPDGMALADLETLYPETGLRAGARLRELAIVQPAAGRLRLLNPVREHLARSLQLEEAELERVARHYAGLAAQGEAIGGVGGREAVARLAPEVGNLAAMVGCLANAGQLDLALAARKGYTDLLRFTGLGSGAILEELAAAAAKQGDVLGQAHCIRSLGDIALARSDHARARAAYERALRLYEQVGDVLGQANCIWSLGDVALARSDHTGAREAYERALPIFEQVGDVLGQANCIRGLGDIALRVSDHAVARGAYERALPLYEQVGSVLGQANCIMRLGDIALARSDHAVARGAYERALPLYEQVGSVLGQANCIASLGDIALASSNHAVARAAYERALPLYDQVGDVLGQANCHMGLGDTALARGDWGAAVEAYERALALYQQVSDPAGRADCIRRLGDLARQCDDLETARARYTEALAIYETVEARNAVGLTHLRLSQVAPDEATREQHRAAAREAWESVDRLDLIAEHLDSQS